MYANLCKHIVPYDCKTCLLCNLFLFSRVKYIPFASSGQNADFVFVGLKSKHVELGISWILRKSRTGTLKRFQKPISESLSILEIKLTPGMIISMLPSKDIIDT